MHPHRTAGAAPPQSTVSGLGVCDAFRLELDPVQLQWLADELEERRGPLEEELRRAPDGSEEAAALTYELRLLRRLRAQLPAAGHVRPFVVVGPAAMVTGLARATLRDVAAALAELARELPAVDDERLRATAAAALAWTRTYLDCQLVESFSFDPEAEPHRVW